MTHTKDTREAIARFFYERAPFYPSCEVLDNHQVIPHDCVPWDALHNFGEHGQLFIDGCYKDADALLEVLTALEPAPAGGDVRELVEAISRMSSAGHQCARQDTMVATFRAIKKKADAAIALTALEPAQAGGDVRERIYKIVCTHRNSTTPDQFTDMILTALTAQADDQTWPDDLVSDDMSNTEFFQALRDYASKRQSEGAKAITISLETFKMLLPDTPAQPTPSGEIDALFEKARDAAAEAERNHRPDPNCSSTAASDAVEAYESVIRAALTATPAQATPSGEVDRADAEKWRALVNCERVRVLGWTHDMNHIGLEFWKRHPAKHPSEEYPQDQDRSTLDSFVLTPPLTREEGS